MKKQVTVVQAANKQYETIWNFDFHILALL